MAKLEGFYAEVIWRNDSVHKLRTVDQAHIRLCWVT